MGTDKKRQAMKRAGIMAAIAVGSSIAFNATAAESCNRTPADERNPVTVAVNGGNTVAIDEPAPYCQYSNYDQYSNYGQYSNYNASNSRYSQYSNYGQHSDYGQYSQGPECR